MKYCSILLIRTEIKLLRKANEDPQRVSPGARYQLGMLRIRRKLAIMTIESIIKEAKGFHEEVGNLLHFLRQFFESLRRQ